MSLRASRERGPMSPSRRAQVSQDIRAPALQALESRSAPIAFLRDTISQQSLPGFGITVPVGRSRKKQPLLARHTTPHRAQPDDELMSCYRKRLAASGAAQKGQALYLFQVQTVLRIASRLACQTITWADLIQNTMLLGRALADDKSPTNPERQLSKWTLASRRSAVRSFVALLRPELTALLGVDPAEIVESALRMVAEPVGLGFRLNGGAPRRRGGSVPTSEEIGTILHTASQVEGFRGMRNRAFFLILAESGARVNALRGQDSAQCCRMPNGTIRLFLHEKGKSESREVELSPAAAEAFRTYATAFNQLAALRGWQVRIRLGYPGPLWRNSVRGSWPYKDVLATLQAACERAGTKAFTPHAFRRAFATDAVASLPRHIVAQAGGWHGLERMDNHYIHPHERVTLEKLAQCEHLPTQEVLRKGYDPPSHRPASAI